MKRLSFRYLFAVVLLALTAFAVRALSLDTQSLWRDEVDALRFATVPWAEIVSNFVRPGWNGPLYFLLLRGWVALTGTTEYAMRFFSLAFGVLCVPLVYVLGRRLFGRQAGLFAGLLVTASPYLTWYGQEVKMYTLLVALALLAIYGLRRAIEGGGWRWWAMPVVATSLACYSHILAALLIPVLVLLYFAWWPQARRRWAGALVSLACLLLPYLPLAVWQVPMVPLERQTGFQFYSLGEMAQVLLDGWSTGVFGSFGWGWSWGVVLAGALAAWGLVSPLILARKEEGQEGRLALVCWLGIPVLAVWLVSLRQPLFTDRYLIWVAPAFYLLIASGLASFLRFEGWGRWGAALLAGVILLFNGVNQWQQATTPFKSNFRAAAAYVANYQPPDEPSAPQASTQVICEECSFETYLPLIAADDVFNELILFQIPYAKNSFDYYFLVDEYPWADGLYTNHCAPDGSYLMGEQEAARRMQELTAAHDVIWLVATEMEMWDRRRLVKAWLDAQARLVDEAHFTWVDVYRYER
jgi:mannosyltransferase